MTLSGHVPEFGASKNAVLVVRGGIVESRQTVHAAVCAADGSLLAAVGDPERLTVLRSVAKPWQARVLLGSGAWYDDDSLAVACGSHSGLPIHVKAVQKGLDAAGVSARSLENDLGVAPDERLRQQCSGSHMAFLAAARSNGWQLCGYSALDHPSQLAAHVELATAAGLDPVQVPVAVDACGVATFALPLRRIAALYARLPTSDPLQFAAMRARPELVAGPGRLDTRLMRTLPGCVAKLGSEALEGIALSEPGIGIAVRIEDGDPTLRALGAATLAILAQLVDTDLSGLDDIAQPMLRVLGRETVAASVRAELELRFC